MAIQSMVLSLPKDAAVKTQTSDLDWGYRALNQQLTRSAPVQSKINEVLWKLEARVQKANRDFGGGRVITSSTKVPAGVTPATWAKFEPQYMKALSIITRAREAGHGTAGATTVMPSAGMTTSTTGTMATTSAVAHAAAVSSTWNVAEQTKKLKSATKAVLTASEAARPPKLAQLKAVHQPNAIRMANPKPAHVTSAVWAAFVAAVKKASEVIHAPTPAQTTTITTTAEPAGDGINTFIPTQEQQQQTIQVTGQTMQPIQTVRGTIFGEPGDEDEPVLVQPDFGPTPTPGFMQRARDHIAGNPLAYGVGALGLSVIGYLGWRAATGRD